MSGPGGNDANYRATRWATENDWEEYRDEITRAYSTKTLKELRKHMEIEHDFRATERMFKTRFRRWQFDKNIKVPEALAIWRVKLRRDEEGKSSSFLLRGNPVNLDRVEQRLRISHAEAFHAILPQRAGDAATLLDGLICRTPSPELLPPPIVLQLPDEILRLTRAYYDGCFMSARWKVGTTFEEFVGRNETATSYKRHDMLFDFAHHFRQANDLLDQNTRSKNREAFDLLQSCFINLPRLLSYQNPTLLNFLLGIALEVACSCGRLELVAHLFECTHGYSKTLLGVDHPLTLIANRVMQLTHRSSQTEAGEKRQILEVAENFSRVGFEDYLVDNPSALFEVHNNGIAYIKKTLGPAGFVNARRQLISRPEVERLSPMIVLKTQFHLAYALYHLKEYTEAAEWVRRMLGNPVLEEYDLTWTKGEVLRLAGRLKAADGLFEDAKELIWASSAIFDSEWPLGDGNQIRLLNDKEWLLREWGRDDEADEVQRERERRVKCLAAEAENSA